MKEYAYGNRVLGVGKKAENQVKSMDEWIVNRKGRTRYYLRRKKGNTWQRANLLVEDGSEAAENKGKGVKGNT